MPFLQDGLTYKGSHPATTSNASRSLSLACDATTRYCVACMVLNG